MGERALSSTVGGVGVAMGRKLQRITSPKTIAAVVVAAGWLVSIFLLVDGLTVLSTWSTGYGGRGAFTVESCSRETGRFSQQIRCSGDIVPEGNQRPITSVLIGPRAAFGSEIPPSGDVIEAYHGAGDTSRAFPLEGRTTELIRAIVGIVPIVFLFGGTATWLLGWFMTRNIPREEGERMPDRHRFPQRFALRPNGATWALVGALWWMGDRWFIDDLLGTAGLG